MFEKFLHQTPYFRFLLPLIGGIFFQILFPNINLPLVIILSILFCIILLFFLTKQTQYFFTNRVWGFLAFVFIFLLGMQLVKNKQKAQPHFKLTENTYIATIIENPTEKKNSFQTVLSVGYLKDSSGLHRENGKVLAYFAKDSSVENLQFGDQLIVESYINPVKHSGNPNTFNYKRYLSFQEIYHQTYIKSGSFKIVDHNKGPILKLLSNKIRNKLLNIYRQNEITGDEFAVLSALTLGYKQELNPEIRSAFSSSGAMHILAVSGLHVGIIYIILIRLLFFLQRNKYGRILQSSIIILLLFFYAFLTGLSSSVLRATLMFAILGFGKMFVRQTNIYNTIFVSAFVMLLANPYSITDVGFQLSYMAVFSIIFFYPKIYSFIEVNHFFADKIWQLIAVAIAAQIGTFPLTLYYFNQFPVYFILANIFIIPIAMILIYAAVSLFLLSFSDLIIDYLAPVVKYITVALNFSVKTISELPFSKIYPVYIDTFTMFILILSVLTISFFIISRRLKFLRLFILFLLIVPFYNLAIKYIKSKEAYFIVYNIPKVSAIDFVKNGKNRLYINQKSTIDSNIIQYNIFPFWQKQKIRQPEIYDQEKKRYNIYHYNNQSFVQINNDSLRSFYAGKKLDVDYMILSESPDITIQELTEYFSFKQLIFDRSNDFYVINRWKEQSKALNVDYYDLAEQGAFIQPL